MTTPTARPDRLTKAGLYAVGAVAAIWSFTALTDLARLCGVTAVINLPYLDWQLAVAWGLPLTVDVCAVVTTRAWLRGDIPAAAVSYARTVAWVAIAATIGGNAYHGLLIGDWSLDALIVNATPAVAIGALAHLIFLICRSEDSQPSNPPRLPPGVVKDPVDLAVIDPGDRPVTAVDRAAAAAHQHAHDNGGQLPTLRGLEQLAGVSRGTAVNAIAKVKAESNGHLS